MHRMAAITCNNCQVLVYKTADGVCLSCGAANWAYENEAAIDKATIVTPYTPPPVPGFTVSHKRRHRRPVFFSYLGPAMILLLLLMLIGPLKQLFSGSKGKASPAAIAAVPLPPASCALSQSAIYDEYKQSVALVWHEYVYEVWINERGPLQFARNGNQFVFLQEGGRPATVTGTGFFTDSTGMLLTNRHVATPWLLNNGREEKNLRAALRSFLQQLPPGTDPLTRIHKSWNRKEGATPDSLQPLRPDSATAINDWPVTIKPKTVFLALAMHNMTANKDSFIQCSLVLADTSKAIDLAVLQTRTRQLPAGAHVVQISAAMMNEDSLRPGSRAIMIGFPKGMDLARLPNGKIKTQVYEGFINKESDGVQIQYDITSDRGASGSPVFNECGRLIAVNYAGYIETQGFNFGILAKHAAYLLGKQRLEANMPTTARIP